MSTWNIASVKHGAAARFRAPTRATVSDCSSRFISGSSEELHFPDSHETTGHTCLRTTGAMQPRSFPRNLLWNLLVSPHGTCICMGEEDVNRPLTHLLESKLLLSQGLIDPSFITVTEKDPKAPLTAPFLTPPPHPFLHSLLSPSITSV